MLRLAILCTLLLTGFQAKALDLDAPFGSIDGGDLSLSQWRGQPILVVNTASQCAFTDQYRDLQDLYDTYRDSGLIVLAVPSDDFQQELATDAEVKDFCELQYGIDMPMTTITHVKGSNAHPFFQSLQAEENFTPRWNFNKVLIDADGNFVDSFGSNVDPLSRTVTHKVEALLK